MGFLLEMFEAELAKLRAKHAAGAAPGQAAASDASARKFPAPRSWAGAPVRQPGRRLALRMDASGVDRSVPAGDRDDPEDDWS